MNPIKVRKRPVVVEAWQAIGIREMERIVKWINSNGGDAKYRPPVNFGPAIDIQTLEGTMTADIFDWVIKGIAGEFYPVKPEIFQKTYETL